MLSLSPLPIYYLISDNYGRLSNIYSPKTNSPSPQANTMNIQFFITDQPKLRSPHPIRPSPPMVKCVVGECNNYSFIPFCDKHVPQKCRMCEQTTYGKEFCTKHACRICGDESPCPIHFCRKKFCNQVKLPGGDYCELHTCGYAGGFGKCTNACLPDEKSCGQHLCMLRHCRELKFDFEKFCISHIRTKH